MADTCFTIKGTSLTTMVLDLYRYSPEEFTRQLQDKIATAPDFFKSSPIYIDVTEFDGALDTDELAQLLGALREHALEPIGCKGAEGATLTALEQTGLARLPASRARKTALEPEPAEPVVQAGRKPSKIVERPVRSGQQVYAEGADLILLAPVSEGAEVMADGHIHVYSALRGRALAGVRDDTSARIFCQKMEAELVSIAGQFIMNETLRERCWKQPAQVYWEDESIHVSALT